MIQRCAGAGSPRPTRVHWLALVALLLVAFLLRAWGIDRYGLWIDEIATTTCLDYTLPSVLDCRRAELGSPLFHVATNLVYTLAGRPPLPAPEWLVRLPELLAGTFVVLAAWLAAREVLGTRGAWLNALLWTFAPTAVAYAQEARMYAWLMLFSNLSTWLLMVGLRRRDWRFALLFGLSAALNFYSHYLAVFVIAGQFLFAALDIALSQVQSADTGPALGRFHVRAPYELRRWIIWLLGAGVVLLALLVPWLPNILNAARGHVLSETYTRVPLTMSYLLNVQSWLVLEAVELPLAALALFVVSVVGVWSLFHRKRMALLFVACWLSGIVGFLLWRHAGFTSFRYWIVLQPPIYWLLTAGGLAAADALTSILSHRRVPVDRRAPYALVAVVGVLALLPSLSQFYADQFESWRFDDWRGAAQFLRAHAKPSDVVIPFGDAAVYHTMAFFFYLPSAPNVPPVVEPDQLTGSLIARANNESGRAWGIVYARDPAELARLRAQGSDRVDFNVFQGLVVISPRPLSPDETFRENALRLASLYRAWDADRFALAAALLTDPGVGKNLLTNPELDARKKGMPRGWKFGAAPAQVISLDGEPALALSGQVKSEGLRAYQQLTLKSGETYILRFECRNTLSEGAQRTYVTFDGSDGKLIVFPNGAGYACPVGTPWHSASFVFHVPDIGSAQPKATLLLRNAGIGDAYWRRLSLYPVTWK